MLNLCFLRSVYFVCNAYKNCSDYFSGFDPDNLKQMGNFVAEFLQPFGIDVDIDVKSKENNDSKQSSSQTTDKTEKSKSSENTENSTEETPTSSKLKDLKLNLLFYVYLSVTTRLLVSFSVYYFLKIME